MDTEKIFQLIFLWFCEKYGTKEKRKGFRRTKSLFQQQEKERKYRYYFNTELAGMLTVFVLLIAVILFALSLMKMLTFTSAVSI